MFHENGYTSAEIAAHFADDQARSFAIFAQEQPVSVCLAYQNYGRIWEIGMVYTVPQARRQGHARKIVETALHLLLANGRMPRYQMADTNQASQALAACLGLTRFLITEHYLYVPAHTSSRNIYANTT